MHRIVPIVCAMLAFGSAAVAKNQEEVQFDGVWSLHIDADGHVSQLQAVSNLQPAVTGPLEAEIRKWQFRPGTVDGKPTGTDTFLTLHMRAHDDARGNAQIHFERASTGAYHDKVNAPKYPVAAITARKQGLVLLKVAYDADGRVTDSQPSADVPQVSDMLTQGARQSVQEWHFKPEVVGGRAIAGHAIVPFCYWLSESGRTPKEPKFCQWKAKDDEVERGKDELVALDSVAQLVTDIHDHTL